MVEVSLQMENRDCEGFDTGSSGPRGKRIETDPWNNTIGAILWHTRKVFSCCQGVVYGAQLKEICCVIWVLLLRITAFGADRGPYFVASAAFCFTISLLDDVYDRMGTLSRRTDESHESQRCLGGTYDRGFFLRPD